MAEFDITAVFKTSGLTEVRAAFKSIEKAADDVDRNFKKFAGSTKDLAKNIGLVTTAVLGTAAALTKLIAGNAEAAESLANVSQRTGITVDALQVYTKIAEDAGISGDSVGKAFTKLTKNIGDLRDPTSGLSKEINELSPGLRTALLATNDATQRIDLLRGVFAGVKDEVTANNLAFALFGKSGSELLPILQLNNKEFDTQEKRIRALNFVLTDTQNQALANFDTAFDDAGTAVQGFSKQLSADLAPLFTTVLTELTKRGVEFSKVFLGDISVAVTELTVVVTDFFKLVSGGPEVEGVDARAKSLYDNFIKLRDAISGAFTFGKTVVTGFFAALDPVAKLFGAGSGLQLGLILLAANFLGVFKVISSFAGLSVSIVKFFGIFIVNLPPIIANLKLFSGAITALRGAFLLLSTALLANPIFLIGAAIVAAIAVIALIIDKTIGWAKAWDLVKQAISAAFDFIKDFAVNVGKFFLDLGKSFVDGFVAATPGLQKFLADVGAIISSWVQGVAQFFSQLPTVILSVFEGLGAAIGFVFESVFDGIKLVFESVINTIKTGIETVTGLIKKAYDGIRSIVSGGNRNAPQTQNANPRQQFFGPGFAGGGHVLGPGSSTSDSIPAWLSNNEYVVKARSVKKYGVGFLNALNSGLLKIQGFASGGFVGDMSSAAMAPLTLGAVPDLSPAMISGRSSGRPLYLSLDGKRYETSASDDVLKSLQKALRKSDIAKPLKSPRWTAGAK